MPRAKIMTRCAASPGAIRSRLLGCRATSTPRPTTVSLGRGQRTRLMEKRRVAANPNTGDVSKHVRKDDPR